MTFLAAFGLGALVGWLFGYWRGYADGREDTRLRLSRPMRRASK